MLGLGMGLWANVAATQGGGQFPGPELVQNGTFTDTSVWALSTGATISGGVLNCSGCSGIARQPITYVTGGVYTLQFDYTMSSGSKLRANLVLASGGDIPAGGTSGALSASGHVSLTFTAHASAAYIQLEADSATFSGTIDNVSLKRTG